MQEFNKFRVITAGFILMFIFVVAAMYTNTKDITAQKMKEAGISDTRNANQYDFDKRKFQNNNQTNQSAGDRVSQLENRVMQIENNLININSELSSRRNSGLNCQIRGVLDNGDVVPLSANEAVEEANMNNREIVITCSVR